jgi:hypothetical protein
MKIYREVKCSERLPEIDGCYFCIDKITGNLLTYWTMFLFDTHKKYNCLAPLEDYKKAWYDNIKSWLEPIEVELDSEKILPEKERITYIDNRVAHYSSLGSAKKIVEQYHKALESAELRIAKFEEEYYNTYKYK